MAGLTLVTGGARSGKSDFALERVRMYDARPKRFIATAVACDQEMQARIAAHRRQRGDGFETVEAPYTLEKELAGLRPGSAVIVDCLTVWLGNLFYTYEDDTGAIESRIHELCAVCETLAAWSCGCVYMVTNEVGWGLVPPDAASRRYRDYAGMLNKEVAARAGQVYLCVSGIPMCVKGNRI